MSYYKCILIIALKGLSVVYTCHASSMVEDRGADARKPIGALDGGSCNVNASKALVCADANCAVTVRARTKYAVAGSNPVIVALSVLYKNTPVHFERKVYFINANIIKVKQDVMF